MLVELNIEDFAIIDQLVRHGFAFKRMIFIDGDYESYGEKKVGFDEKTLSEQLMMLPEAPNLKGQKRCFAQLMTWFNSYVRMYQKFDVVVYKDLADYLQDLERDL